MSFKADDLVIGDWGLRINGDRICCIRLFGSVIAGTVIMPAGGCEMFLQLPGPSRDLIPVGSLEEDKEMLQGGDRK